MVFNERERVIIKVGEGIAEWVFNNPKKIIGAVLGAYVINNVRLGKR